MFQNYYFYCWNWLNCASFEFIQCIIKNKIGFFKMGWIFHFCFIFIETFPLITWLHHELMNVELSLFDVQIRCLIKLSLGYYKDVVSTNP